MENKNAATQLNLPNMQSIGSHLSIQDHEIALQEVIDNPLSIGEVATTLTESQKWFVLKRLHFDALVSLEELPPQATFMFEKIEQMTIEEAVEILEKNIKEHETDVNIPENDLILWKELVEMSDKHTKAELQEKLGNNSSSSVEGEKTGDVEQGHEIVDWGLQVRLEAVLVAYWSPYPEVRAVTFPYDDPTIPVETFRVYLIGIIWTAIGAVINQFFTERQPAITLAMAVVQVFLYPSGLLCEWFLPKWKFKIWKYTIDLNPGPYTYKEQMLATIFCGVTGGSTSYVSSNILMQKSEIFYDNKWVDFGYQVLLILSTNFLGVGFAGIMRKFAVYPTKAVWPSILPGLALNKTLLTPAKKEEIGPPFYSAANLVVYGAFFAIYPFHFVYEIGMNYDQMWDACTSFWRVIKDFRKSTYDGFDDPHSTMMRAYPEVPEWAYLIIVVISLVLAILCVKLYPAQTPVWGIFFALGINFIFLIPLTTIYARTGFAFGLNVLVELIVGYAIPGNGLALAFIKALGYNIDAQAQNFVNDLKQGHYAKLPPRAVYRVQLLSIFISSFIQLGILNFQINGIKDYCKPGNTQKFTCPGGRTFFSASVLWGVIGPKKVFNGLYPVLAWCFLIGFLLAFPCIAIKKYAPRKYVKYFEPSIVIGGFLKYAPYNLSYYIPGVYVSYAFMSYIKRKYEAWWQKYTYVLSTGLNAGIAFSSIIIFFAVMYHEKDINWWGNTVMYSGVDYAMTGWLNATVDAPDGYFGPRRGNFP
ncbi:OPT family small oligopeptide transporter [Candida albicans P75010]|nr:OPT family small oligopeptide transporter [Candida albicans P75010]